MPTIITAGMRHSGSTWAFNAVRLILLACDKNLYSCYYELGSRTNQFDPSACREYNLFKVHTMIPFTGDELVITSVRDLRDIAASAVRKGVLANETNAILPYVGRIVETEYRPWLVHSDFEIVYHELVGHKPEYIQSLAQRIGFEVDADEIHRQVELLPLPRTRTFDPVTHMHRDHRTDGRASTFRGTLAPETVAAIESHFASWFEERGIATTQRPSVSNQR